MNNDDHVECPVCNKHFKIITNTHILSHNMTVEEFDLKYPNVIKVCNTIKTKLKKLSPLANTTPRINKNTYMKNPKLCKHCNEILDYENRKNSFCSNSCSSKFSNENRDYKTHTELVKIKMSEIAKYQYSVGIRIKNFRLFSKINYKNCPICNKLFITCLYYKKCYSHVCSKNCSRIFKVNSGVKLSNSFKNQKTYKQYTFNSKYYGEVKLDSNWEVMVVNSLELNNVKWERGKKFKWIKPTDNSIHHYYPDFYLPEYNVYVEPKNPYKWETDYNFEKFKINYVIKEHKLKIIMILDRKYANWEYIKTQIPLAV